jgi:hypothetical protein
MSPLLEAMQKAEPCTNVTVAPAAPSPTLSPVKFQGSVTPPRP